MPIRIFLLIPFLFAAVSCAAMQAHPSVDQLGARLMRLENPTRGSIENIMGTKASISEDTYSWKIIDYANHATLHVLKKGHKAFPGYIARELIEEETTLAVRTTGKYHGDEKAYDGWSKSVLPKL